MGQYYRVVNLDRKEYLVPHDFSDGMKLLEFGGSSAGTMAALASLLVLDSQHCAPWACSGLVLAGDYADPGTYGAPVGVNLYRHLADAEREDSAGSKASSQGGLGRRNSAGYLRVGQAAVCDAAHEMGLSVELVRERKEPFAAVLEKSKVFDQPEDLFEALGVDIREDLAEVMSDVLWWFRFSTYTSPLEGAQCSTALLELDDQTGRARSLTIRCWFPGRGAATEEGVLPFPATGAQVKSFLRMRKRSKT